MKPRGPYRNIPGKWRKLSREDRVLFLEAFFFLAAARLAILLLSFPRLARTLGRHMKESEARHHPADQAMARKIGRAVSRAANHTPWESVCLPRALTGQWMLKRRGIPATLYFGLAKDDARPQKLAGHAWLRCGDLIVTGREGLCGFTVVGCFGTVDDDG